jgi:hypothetical protein
VRRLARVASLQMSPLSVALDLLAIPMVDRVRLSLRFRRRFGYWPGLREQQSFNEHMLRYKLSSRGDERLPRLADKLAAKEHIAALVGPEHVVPTYWQGREFPAREERTWPRPYVIKSTHACRQLILVRDEKEEDWDRIEPVAAQWISEAYAAGRWHREWHYAQIHPRLLVEAMLGDGVQPPPDYKFFVFGGRAELVEVDEGRYVDHRRSFFDRNWKLMPFGLKYPRPAVPPPRPSKLAEMIRIAETLGRDFEFVRVDLYEVDGRVYCGELTFFPIAGMGRFDPPEADFLVGGFWPSVTGQAMRGQFSTS